MGQTERITYVKVKGHEGYVGYPVNLPSIIIQADSLDELKTRTKEVYQSVLEHLGKEVSKEDPFELYHEEDDLVWIHGRQEAELIIKLLEANALIADLKMAIEELKEK